MRRVVERRGGRLAAVLVACLVFGGLVGCGERTLVSDDSPVSGAPITPAAERTADPAMPAVTELADVAALVNGQALVLPGGRRIDLSKLGEATDAVRTRDGWLVTGAGPSLWLVRPNGAPRRLVRATEGRVAVAPDGRGLAWRDGDALRTGHLTAAGEVVMDRSTPAPARGAPVVYTGTAVVLGYSETGGGWDRRDVWVPARGPYSPAWNANVMVRAIFGIAPDGRSVVGLVARGVGTKDTCLALLDPARQLATRRTACLPVRLLDHAALSATGRWLAVGTTDDSGGAQVAVIDLRKVFARPAVVGVWPGEPGGVWLDERTFLHTGANGLLTRFTVGRAAGAPVSLRGVAEGEDARPVGRARQA